MAKPPAGSAESVKVEIVLNEGGYAIGEPIVMKLVVTNLTLHPVQLYFPTAQRYDFVVTKGDNVLWRWSDDKMFAQVTSELTLDPKAKVTYEATWDQRTTKGENLPLGRYMIRGIVKTQPNIESEPRVFAIVD